MRQQLQSSATLRGKRTAMHHCSCTTARPSLYGIGCIVCMICTLSLLRQLCMSYCHLQVSRSSSDGVLVEHVLTATHISQFALVSQGYWDL
jgi:hypothetical protein